MNVASVKAQKCEKKSFECKTSSKDGLVVKVHHTIDNKCKRFLYATFDRSGCILATADIDGNIFIIDFSYSKFWSVPNTEPCSILSFCDSNSNLIYGNNLGTLFVLNIHIGVVIGILEGHKLPVKNISYINHLCLTSSNNEAIIYDLVNCNIIHKLTLTCELIIKQACFVPISNHILICFSDDYIQVWENKTFDTFKRISPKEWKNFTINSISFTRNGSTMVVAGRSSTVALFSLDTWTITKLLQLPQKIHDIRFIDFVTQTHDGGANKFLIILSKSGVLYFVNMETNVILTKLQLDSEIISFSTSRNGIYLSIVLHAGQVFVYKMTNFIEKCTETQKKVDCKVASITMNRKLKLHIPPTTCPRDNLDLNRLREILNEYGEYPEAFRTLIWSKILVLPFNRKCFTSLMNKGFHSNFKSIEKKYPLANKTSIKNLKRLLSNLGHWCPIFYYVDYMPLFVFPFLKIFENDPVACFECLVTVIINWCQHWFEYLPCSPINVLAIIENIFSEHDSQLLSHLHSYQITSQTYAWALLEVAFSEILTIKQWCVLWDHILSNEPSFLVCIPVAYSTLNRTTLSTMKTQEDFELFYHQQNAVDIKKLISKTHYLLKKTSSENHPRKYFQDFLKLSKGSYPIFDNFPKAALECEENKSIAQSLSEQEMKTITNEICLKEIFTAEKRKNDLLKKEEYKRLQDLAHLYQKDREEMEQQKLLLDQLKTNLYTKQKEDELELEMDEDLIQQLVKKKQEFENTLLEKQKIKIHEPNKISHSRNTKSVSNGTKQFKRNSTKKKNKAIQGKKSNKKIPVVEVHKMQHNVQELEQDIQMIRKKLSKLK